MTPEEIRAIPDPMVRFQAAQVELLLALDPAQEMTSIKREVVQELRGQGFTWEKVGQQLGISRQRAQQLGSRTATRRRPAVTQPANDVERIAAALDVPTEVFAGPPDTWHWSELHEQERQALLEAFPSIPDVPGELLPPEFATWLREHGYRLGYETEAED